MASLALMLVTAWLMSEGRPAAWTFYPMIFMFVTTMAALLYTSYSLLKKVFTGAVKGEALIGNTLMGLGWVLPGHCGHHSGLEGFKAFSAIGRLKGAGRACGKGVAKLAGRSQEFSHVAEAASRGVL